MYHRGRKISRGCMIPLHLRLRRWATSGIATSSGFSVIAQTMTISCSSMITCPMAASPTSCSRGRLRDRHCLWTGTCGKILVGAAQGLSYLHHDCVPAILHRDVKPNNILLDSKYQPFLADFGLAKLIEGSDKYPEAMSKVAGSYGYIAPGKA